MVYIGGAPGMRITFAGIFSNIPALLFGPLYGGMASGILDIIGYLMKPEGAFIPWYTVVAVLGGVITGFLWRLIKNIDIKNIQKFFLYTFISIGIIGLFNHLTAALLPGTAWGKAIESVGKNRDFVTIGLEAMALIGLGLLLLNYFIQKKQKNVELYHNYLKLLVVIGISGFIVTTLNTFVLRIFIPSLGQIGFMIYWIPRVIKEALISVLQAYIIAFLLSIYDRVFLADKIV